MNDCLCRVTWREGEGWGFRLCVPVVNRVYTSFGFDSSDEANSAARDLVDCIWYDTFYKEILEGFESGIQ